MPQWKKIKELVTIASSLLPNNNNKNNNNNSNHDSILKKPHVDSGLPPFVGDFDCGDALSPFPPINFNQNAECEAILLGHSFGFSFGAPAVTDWKLPAICNKTEWSDLSIELETTSSGVQFDRISALWVGGLELLRTSTQEPGGQKIVYRLEKDVSEYIPFLQGTSTTKKLVLALDNLINDVYTGHFNVTLTAKVKYSQKNTENNFADLILPLSKSDDYYGYFGIQPSDPTPSVTLQNLPRNIQRAEIQVYTSHHQNDEFYYTNTLNPWRELVEIDGTVVGVFSTFPLIFTGGITPYLWRPVVAIGALNAPTYTIDVSPFASILSDGSSHTITFKVQNSTDIWYTSGNLKVWTLKETDVITGGLSSYNFPNLDPKIIYTGNSTDGTLDMSLSRYFEITGYINHPDGTKLYTSVKQSYSFSNSQTFTNDTNSQTFDQRVYGENIVTRSDGITKQSSFDYPFYGNMTFIQYANPKHFSLYSDIDHSRKVTTVMTDKNGQHVYTDTVNDSQKGNAYLHRLAFRSTGSGNMEQLFSSYNSASRKRPSICYNQDIKVKELELVVNDFDYKCKRHGNGLVFQ